MSNIYDHEGNRKYLTVAERTAFLQAAENMSEEVYTMCAVLAYSGARLSEVLALTPERIDMHARILLIESLKKRRDGVFRAVPIPAKLITDLDRVHQVSAARRSHNNIKDRLWTFCRTTAWKRVKTCMEKAGISGLQASPKGLRHAFAVASLQSGVPINFVRKWLGHSRLATTEIYADAVGEEEQNIAGRLWGTF
ncbi:MAG: site-specific integrase [Magnetococcales bacterium]|nr:site-specific integrase [Magnetococcales bacterium]